MAALQKDEEKSQPGWRLRNVFMAIRQAYGQSSRVHAKLMEYSLSHGPGTRLHPLYTGIIQMLALGT